MKITIISVGNIKESYFLEAIKEYKKRLSKYVTLNEIVIDDYPNIKDENKVKEKEGEAILKAIPKDSYVICLTLDGLSLDSVGLSNKLKEIFTYHSSHLCFIIGGSLGLDSSVINKAFLKLSFSKLTFPHKLFKVILLEQIYRSFKILNNETYHK